MTFESVALPQALTFALVFCRMAGLATSSPFPGEQVPVEQRAGFAIVLAFAALPVAPLYDGAPDLTLVLAALSEVFVGLAAGAVLRVLLSAADIAGGIIAQSAGLGAASLFNPALGAQDTTVARILSLLAMLLVLAAGVHRTVLAYVLESVRVMPVGSHVRIDAAFATFAPLAAGCVSFGIRLALPAMAVSVVLQVALAMVSRAAPSLQLFNVGFAILVLGVLTTVATSVDQLGAALLEHTSQVGLTLDRLFTDLATAR